MIKLWPSPDDLAADVGAKPDTVRKWRTRNRIPPEWWQPIIQAAETRGTRLTASELACIANKHMQAAE